MKNITRNDMGAPISHPTPYPDVNAVLVELLEAARTILGDYFIGLYLHGSLATGDFDPQQSDIDFIVVTAAELPEEMVAALKTMHGQIVGGGSKWPSELEGSYISSEALRSYNPARAVHPHIERGGGLQVEQHESDWVIQRHIIREQGVVVAGPDPKTLIDPVHPAGLRRALVNLLHGWWSLQIEDPSLLQKRGYQVYAIMTMCRALYTLKYGTIVSKPAAARWAMETLDDRWEVLIDRALRRDVSPATLSETLDFIRYTVEMTGTPQ